MAQTKVRLGRCFVIAASHECRPSWMTSQWSVLTNQRPLFHTRYFCNTYEKFHGTFHTCMNSYVEDFLRVSNQTRLKKIRVCKIPWMILHNDTPIKKITRMKNYTYGKLHVWKTTRMKNYTYWILSSDWCIVISVWILSRNYWYVLRFIHALHFIRVTFDEFCLLRPTEIMIWGRVKSNY